MITTYSDSIQISSGFNYRFGNTVEIDEHGVLGPLTQRRLFLYNYYSNPSLRETFRFIRFHFYGLEIPYRPMDWNGGTVFLSLTFGPELEEHEIVEIVMNCLVLEKLSKP